MTHKNLSNSRYFITGANGLVGSYILRKIVMEGGSVLALKRQNSNLQFVRDIPNVEWVEGDLSMSNLSELLVNIDFVIHCAGMVSFRRKDQEKLMQINRFGTENLVDASLESSIKKFCHISSVAALGNTQTCLIDEQDTWDNRNPTSVYALSKHLAEREVWRGIAEGLSAIIVNPSVVLGNGDFNRSTGKLFKYILKNTVYYPQGNLNVVDADDVARAVYQLLHTDIESERFILNAQCIEVKTLLKLIYTELNRKMPFFRVSTNSLKKVHNLMKFVDMIVGGSSSTSTAISSLLEASEYDSSKIQRMIEFEFTNFEASIQKVTHQYLKQK